MERGVKSGDSESENFGKKNRVGIGRLRPITSPGTNDPSAYSSAACFHRRLRRKSVNIFVQKCEGDDRIHLIIFENQSMSFQTVFFVLFKNINLEQLSQ